MISIHWRALQHAILNDWDSDSRAFPWRNGAKPEWTSLVTEVLLQRTRAEAVHSVYDRFFCRFQTTESLGAATTDEIQHEIYSLGLHWRAEQLRLLGRALSALDDEVPADREDLLALPGVGPYASAAFLTLHRNRPRMPFVDANVVRLLGRVGGFAWDGETRRKSWFLALVEQLFDHEYEPRAFGYALLDFTHDVCGRTPDCDTCAIGRASCAFGAGGARE